MPENDQKSAAKQQTLVVPQVSFEERMKNMNELYETNSYHPPVKEAGPSETED
jgi:hypothetical protein